MAMDGATATRWRQRQWKACGDDNEWHNDDTMATTGMDGTTATAMDGATATAIEGATAMQRQ